MNYSDAAETLLSRDTVVTVLMFLIALCVLLVLAAQVVKACKELFGKKPGEQDFAAHCKAADERFKAGEKHIAENYDNIADLREGQRVCCISLMALLGHELHNGNSAEMEDAQKELNKYLINRK